MKKEFDESFIEIAKEAGFVFWADEEWKPENAFIDWGSSYDEELRKFCELTVRRCIEICEKGTETQTTSSGAAILIKQYFGI